MRLITVFILINNKDVKRLKKKINPYSAKNKNTNGTDLYSVLKPDTSSLSPSANLLLRI